MTNTCTTKKYPEVCIVSSGRSGTTLLRAILNAGEQIYIPHESDFIARAFPYFSNKEIFNESDYRVIAKLFRETSRQCGWGLSEEELVECLRRLAPQSFAEVNAALNQVFHENMGTDRLLWGVKAPVLIASLDRVLETFPLIKIVHMVRDGRDVYLSYRRVHEKSQVKFGPKGIISNALYWVDGLRKIEECCTSNFYEIKYEDMLGSPEASLKSLCQFLGIDYAPKMHENYHLLDRNQILVSEQFMQSFHHKVKGGLDSRNLNKYQSEMTRVEQLIFEFFAYPYLAKYGYALEFPFLGTIFLKPLRLVIYSLARLFNDLRYQKRDRDTVRRVIKSKFPS